jgi:hypothetical protein
MTTTIVLNETQIQAIHDSNLNKMGEIVDAAKKGAVPKETFVFFAAFDGTNNDMNDLSGDPQSTNVGQLWDQYKVGGDKHLHGGYYAGLGTKGKPTKETWLPPAVTLGAIETAKKAYEDFAREASDWLNDYPRGTVTVVLAAFSRGAASAVIFSQLLYKRGLVLPYPSGKVLIQPGKASISAGVLFDPVATGVEGNLAFPPNVKNVVAIKALNEYRRFFKAVNYSKQKAGVTTIGMYGNHCDIGGGYDNGLGALSLEAATKFLQKSGLPISDVPPSRKCDPTQIVVHSEEEDDYGNKVWDVYNKDGFSFRESGRLFDRDVVVKPAARPTASGTRGFTLYDSTRITF